MNGVQTRFKCKLDVKRCKRFVFPPSSLLPRSNALKTKAIRYFQTDRTLTRIVSPPLLDAEQILVEIQKEYHKEFLSEGVMFYYYKRTGTKTIPNYTEDMEDAQYVLPYPEFEIQSGRVQ